ncbi:MAG: hypothetical protein AAFO07_23200 [Bacteroidota bacterium]
MRKNIGFATLIGFLLAGIGFLTLVLSVVGAQLRFFEWIEAFGALPGFVIKLVMILVGIVIIYLAQTDFEGKNT